MPSGVAITKEHMNQLKQFWKRFEETQDLFNRGMATYPVRRDLAALKRRWDNGDRNVVPYADENGNIYNYKLEFTRKQREELRKAYRQAKNRELMPDEIEDRVFVGIIERFGAAIPDFISIEPPDQKTRLRAIDSFVNGVEKMDSALAEMDSSALGWLYATAVDKLSSEGVQVSTGDSNIVSMRRHPMRAQVEAGEMRHELRTLAGAIVSAARDAQTSLPKYERNDNDARLQTVKGLERQIIEHGIEFVTTESGFPAQCLRSMFELAGLDTEKVSYWLNKAADDPDSFARFSERMSQKYGGENPPAL